MAPALDSLQRRFAVHAADDAPARLVDGVSFEDAALHFLEDSHSDTGEEEVQLFVEDCETGERQCFRIDLETGEAAPCG